MNLSEAILSYDSAAGQAPIRTKSFNNEMYFSLFDVVKAISIENRHLDPNRPGKRLIGLLKAHATHLKPDEIYTPDDLPTNIDEPHRESYVTRAGLFRVILQDNSPACYKFQKWVLNDVLPSITETGEYRISSKKSTTSTDTSTDVVVLTKLFLKEMEERRESEKKIKNDISGLKDEVAELKTTKKEFMFFSVTNHPKTAGLTDNDMYEVFTWCLNLCSLEPGFESIKISTDTKYDKAFKPAVIEQALERWSRNKRA